MNPLVVTIAVALIAVGSLASAVFLTWNGDDATAAWAAFTGAFGILAGQQMETPVAGVKK